MATRTLKFLGLAYGAVPASVTVTANGIQIFNGTVSTVDEAVPPLPSLDLSGLQTQLFTYEIDTEFSGLIPMTCTVNSGTVIFGSILANYVTINNPAFNQEQFDIINNPSSTIEQLVAVYSEVANPPFSSEEIAILENPDTPPEEIQALLVAHNCTTLVNGGAEIYQAINSNTDPRNTVIIDGVEQNEDPRDLAGTWWWTIANGSVLAYDLEVDPVTT